MGERPAHARRVQGAPPPPRRPDTWQRVSRRAAAVAAVLPTDVTADDLDPAVRRELRLLPPVTADVVARHLVVAGNLLDSDDTAGALRHARAAKALAGRLGVVRESAGVAAYRAGEYAEALADLRAARRLTGSPEALPLIADCERGLGRPDRALAVVKDPAAARLPVAVRVELAIVASGARRDLGQGDAAVLALRGAELDADNVQPWTVRLWYAYAEALLAAGRRQDAQDWFAAAASVDEAEDTDAGARAAALDGRPTG